MAKNETVYVNILDKEYQVACPEEERSALSHAANTLDQRMRAIRASGTIIGTERIAIMAALNLCHELQQSKVDIDDGETLNRLVDKIDKALNGL